MPVGPNGQIRPESTMSAVIMACKIATGEIKEKYSSEAKEPLKSTRSRLRTTQRTIQQNSNQKTTSKKKSTTLDK